MKKVRNENWSNLVPEVTINSSLNKYENAALFPEKLAWAKHELKNVKLPVRIIKTSEEHFTENHGEPGSATRIEFEKKAKSFALQELLLNGPVFSEDQIKEIEETHKSINIWRANESENLC